MALLHVLMQKLFHVERGARNEPTPLGLIHFWGTVPRIARWRGQPWAGGGSPVGAWACGRRRGWIQIAAAIRGFRFASPTATRMVRAAPLRKQGGEGFSQ